MLLVFSKTIGKSGSSLRFHGASSMAFWLVAWLFGPNGRLYLIWPAIVV